MFGQKKNLNNIYGGLKAKNNGDYFERILETKCMREQITFVKIPSGCKWVRTNVGVRPVPVKTPFDFVMCKDGKSVYFDAKCVSTNTFSHSKLKGHQIDKLFEIEQQNFIAGYIIHFKEENKIVFFTSSTLKNLKPRHSLNSECGLFLGSVESFSLIPLLMLGV